MQTCQTRAKTENAIARASPDERGSDDDWPLLINLSVSMGSLQGVRIRLSPGIPNRTQFRSPNNTPLSVPFAEKDDNLQTISARKQGQRSADNGPAGWKNLKNRNLSAVRSKITAVWNTFCTRCGACQIPLLPSREPMKTTFSPDLESPSVLTSQAVWQDRFADCGRTAVCPALTEDVWVRLQSGLEQWFQAATCFLNSLFTARRLPQEIDCLLNATRRQQLERWRTVYSAPRGRQMTWAWPGSADLMLQADGSVQIMDVDFALPSGLERLQFPGCRSLAESRSRLSQSLFGPGSLPWGTGRAVLLDPGTSGASGHCSEFLSWLLDVPQVTAADLSVQRGELTVQTATGRLPVDAVIRRVDDDWLDPNCGRPDSLVGVPGLVRCWQAGQVSLYNPPGSGLLRHRSIAALIPECIRVFLGQVPLLDSVPTADLESTSDRSRIFRNSQHYAFRTDDPLHPARPWFGDDPDAVRRNDLFRRIEADPARWIARPLPIPNTGRRSLRLFGSLHRGFHLLPGALVRMCDADGGAPAVIRGDAAAFPVWRGTLPQPSGSD